MKYTQGAFCKKTLFCNHITNQSLSFCFLLHLKEHTWRVRVLPLASHLLSQLEILKKTKNLFEKVKKDLKC